MLRLTLRSASDGRVLARVVDRDGSVFVLDHGEAASVAEAAQLVLHGGFQVSWQGTVDTAVPRTPNFLQRLALHWVGQGHLVFVDEPDWPRRGGIDPQDVPRVDEVGTGGPMPLSANLDLLESLTLDDPVGPNDLDAETEIVSRVDAEAIDVTAVRSAVRAPYPDPSVDPEAPTEERPRRS